jgi:hypothetical protein
LWAILIVVQVPEVVYVACRPCSICHRCAGQVLHLSTRMSNCVLKHTLIILVCNKFQLFLFNFDNITCTMHYRWVEIHDFLFS